MRCVLLGAALCLLTGGVEGSSCGVTEWVEWSGCKGDCELGWEVRNRDVIAAPLPSLRSNTAQAFTITPCPPLYQVRPCLPRFCQPSAEDLTLSLRSSESAERLRNRSLVAEEEEGELAPLRTLADYSDYDTEAGLDSELILIDESSTTSPLAFAQSPRPSLVPLPASTNLSSPGDSRNYVQSTQAIDDFTAVVPELVFVPSNASFDPHSPVASEDWRPVWALVWAPVMAEDKLSELTAQEDAILISKLNDLLKDGQYSLYKVGEEPSEREGIVKEDLEEVVASIQQLPVNETESSEETTKIKELKAAVSGHRQRLRHIQDFLQLNPVWQLVWTLPVNETAVEETANWLHRIVQQKVATSTKLPKGTVVVVTTTSLPPGTTTFVPPKSAATQASRIEVTTAASNETVEVPLTNTTAASNETSQAPITIPAILIGSTASVPVSETTAAVEAISTEASSTTSASTSAKPSTPKPINEPFPLEALREEETAATKLPTNSSTAPVQPSSDVTPRTLKVEPVEALPRSPLGSLPRGRAPVLRASRQEVKAGPPRQLKASETRPVGVVKGAELKLSIPPLLKVGVPVTEERLGELTPSRSEGRAKEEEATTTTAETAESTTEATKTSQEAIKTSTEATSTSSSLPTTSSQPPSTSQSFSEALESASATDSPSPYKSVSAEAAPAVDDYYYVQPGITNENFDEDAAYEIPLGVQESVVYRRPEVGGKATERPAEPAPTKLPVKPASLGLGSFVADSGAEALASTDSPYFVADSSLSQEASFDADSEAVFDDYEARAEAEALAEALTRADLSKAQPEEPLPVIAEDPVEVFLKPLELRTTPSPTTEASIEQPFQEPWVERRRVQESRIRPSPALPTRAPANPNPRLLPPSEVPAEDVADSTETVESMVKPLAGFLYDTLDLDDLEAAGPWAPPARSRGWNFGQPSYETTTRRPSRRFRGRGGQRRREGGQRRRRTRAPRTRATRPTTVPTTTSTTTTTTTSTTTPRPTTQRRTTTTTRRPTTTTTERRASERYPLGGVYEAESYEGYAYYVDEEPGLPKPTTTTLPLEENEFDYPQEELSVLEQVKQMSFQEYYEEYQARAEAEPKTPAPSRSVEQDSGTAAPVALPWEEEAGDYGSSFDAWAPQVDAQPREEAVPDIEAIAAHRARNGQPERREPSMLPFVATANPRTSPSTTTDGTPHHQRDTFTNDWGARYRYRTKPPPRYSAPSTASPWEEESTEAAAGSVDDYLRSKEASSSSWLPEWQAEPEGIFVSSTEDSDAVLREEELDQALREQVEERARRNETRRDRSWREESGAEEVEEVRDSGMRRRTSQPRQTTTTTEEPETTTEEVVTTSTKRPTTTRNEWVPVWGVSDDQSRRNPRPADFAEFIQRHNDRLDGRSSESDDYEADGANVFAAINSLKGAGFKH